MYGHVQPGDKKRQILIPLSTNEASERRNKPKLHNLWAKIQAWEICHAGTPCLYLILVSESLWAPVTADFETSERSSLDWAC